MNTQSYFSYVPFVHKLIRAHNTWERDGYTLSIGDVPFSDKKLFLSYLLDADDYAYALENDTRAEAYIREEAHVMQHLIDEEIDQVFLDDMRALDDACVWKPTYYGASYMDQF